MRNRKSDIVKYIFIIFLIVLAIVTYVIYQKKNSSSSANDQTSKEENYNIVKEINLGIASFDSINPLLTTNKNVQQISKLVYDSLVTFDEEYNFGYSLAKEISKTGSKEYTIKLKEGVFWQSGESFTAQDVKFTIDTLKTLKSSLYYGNVTNIEEANVVDETTLNIVLKNQADFFEYNLIFPILSQKYYENEDFSTTTKNLTPTGTGMYKIESASEDCITLVKNTNYWDISNKDAIIENININLYSSVGEVYTAFKNGNIDLVDTNLKNVQEYVGTLGYTAATYKTKEFDYLVFNCKTTCLSESDTRRALSLAINISSIVSSCYNSNYSASNFPLDYGNWVCSGLSMEHVYSVEQAKETLQDAGWKYSNNSWSKTINGKSVKLEFTITVNEKNSTDISVAQTIKSQLSKIGVNVTIKKVAKDTYYNYINKKSGYEAIIVNINNSYSPNINTYLGSGNTSNYSNDTMQNLLNQIYAEGDANTIKELYEQVIKLYSTDVPFIGIARKNGVVIYNTNLVGTTKPTSYNIFSKFQNWYKKNY